VLDNWRRHREDSRSAQTLVAKLDPYASGIAFAAGRSACRFARLLATSPARTQLLGFDWQRFGRIDVYEQPAS
jgi:hypothetical protein